MDSLGTSTTNVTKLPFGYCLPSEREAPGARIFSPTGTQSTGAVEHHQKLLGLYLCLLFEMYMRPSDGLALRGIQSLPPIKGIAGAAV